MNATSISWTEKTWNPISGCTPISEGCANCYAKRMAQRLRGRCGYPADGDPFRVILHPDRLDEPCRLRKPSRIFVCSMGDLFHEAVEGQYIREVWGIMRAASKHTFIVLTKRPHRLLAWTLQTADRLSRPIEEIWPGNCWLGVTCENQARADERIPVLLEVPAAVRFVSVEPMLGLVDLSCYLSWQYHVNLPEEERPRAMAEHWAGMHRLTKLDWVICGGETGPGARPMHPDWVRGLRDQCQAAGVPFHFKSWGEWAPNYAGCPPYALSQLVSDGNNGVLKMWRVGAKTSGRLLDGREWDEWPEVTTHD